MRNYFANLAHPRAAIASLLALVVLLLVLASAPLWPSKMTVAGGLLLTDFDGSGISSSDGECSGAGGYSDISEGTDVVVKDATGRLLAAGELAAGVPEEESGRICSFKFEVPDVPRGEGPYTVEVSHRGDVAFKESRASSIVVTLGDY